MKRAALKGKVQKLLMLVVTLVLVCAMGKALNVQAQDDRFWIADLKVGDIVPAGTRIYHGNASLAGVTLDGVDKYYDKTLDENNAFYWMFNVDIRLEDIETKEGNSNDYKYLYKFVIYIVPAGDSDEPVLSEEQKAQLRAEAWKRSPRNPKNYLPEVTLADGSTVVSTVPAHYMSGKDGGVSAVFSTTELGDFYRALGVSGGNGVHLYSYKSLCGPLMKQLFADHVAALSEKCGAEVTVADIFEMQAEIRDKNYKLVEVVTESSEAVDIVIGLQGELLKAAEAGADFAVLVYADGEMTVCMDTDEEVSSLTIHTTKTSGIYAIVYAPAGAFAGLE